MSIHIKNTGTEIGRKVPNIDLENWNGSIFTLSEIKKQSILIFISVYCSHCIDFLPEINKSIKGFNGNVLLFSNGTNEEHKEMVEYFKWDFPVFSIESEEVEEIFGVVYLPFIIIVDEHGVVLNKGVSYNKTDFEFIIKGVGGYEGTNNN